MFLKAILPRFQAEYFHLLDCFNNKRTASPKEQCFESARSSNRRRWATDKSNDISTISFSFIVSSPMG